MNYSERRTDWSRLSACCNWLLHNRMFLFGLALLKCLALRWMDGRSCAGWTKAHTFHAWGTSDANVKWAFKEHQNMWTMGKGGYRTLLLAAVISLDWLPLLLWWPVVLRRMGLSGKELFIKPILKWESTASGSVLATWHWPVPFAHFSLPIGADFVECSEIMWDKVLVLFNLNFRVKSYFIYAGKVTAKSA